MGKYFLIFFSTFLFALVQSDLLAIGDTRIHEDRNISLVHPSKESITCLISKVTLKTVLPCQNTSSIYSSVLEITYVDPPSTGFLVVNGQNFDIISSPQQVILANLVANGVNVGVQASFSEAANCTFTNSELFVAPKAPMITLSNSVLLCNDQSKILIPNIIGGQEYQWSLDGFALVGAINSEISVGEPGEYTIKVKGENECYNEASTKVIGVPSPVIDDLPSVANGCQGSPAILEVVASNYTSVRWFYDDNPIPNTNMTTFPAWNSGKYSVEAKNDFGCTVKKDITVNILFGPTVQLGDEIKACKGGEVTLFAGSQGTNYVWQKDGVEIPNTSNNLKVMDSGKYIVTVTNQGMCATIDSVDVVFVDIPTLDLGSDQIICNDESTTFLAQTNALNATYKWLLNGDVIFDESSPSLNASKGGNYEVIISGGNPQCEVRKSVNLTVNPKPGVNLMNDRTICVGDAFPTLDGGPNNTSYQWTFNGQDIGDDRTIIADQSGLYAVVVKNSFGCVNRDEVKVTIAELPILNLEEEYILCDGNNLIIRPESDAIKYEWKLNNESFSESNDSVLLITTPGNYRCTAFSPFLCTTSQLFNVTGRPSPTVSLGIDVVLCPNDSITLSGGDQFKYLWSDGSELATLKYNSGRPDVRFLDSIMTTVSNEFGCTDQDTMYITTLPGVKATITSDANDICLDQTINLVADGGVTYTWIDTSFTLNMLVGKEVSATLQNTTLYKVIAKDNYCINNTDTVAIKIVVHNGNEIKVTPDTCVIRGKSIVLQASGGVQYTWDHADLINGDPNKANITVSPQVETVFTVGIEDEYGCSFEKEVLVCVLPDPKEKILAINMITPNGDGKNDFLVFNGLDLFPENNLKIYTRWGHLIYEANRYQNGGALFEGMVDGQRLPPDTYYYILTFSNQEIKSALTILW